MIAARIARWLGGPGPVVAAEVPPDEETRARREAAERFARRLWQYDVTAWDAKLEQPRKFASHYLFLQWLKRQGRTTP